MSTAAVLTLIAFAAWYFGKPKNESTYKFGDPKRQGHSIWEHSWDPAYDHRDQLKLNIRRQSKGLPAMSRHKRVGN